MEKEKRELRTTQRDERTIRRLQNELVGRRFEGACLSRISFKSIGNERILKWLKGQRGIFFFTGAPGVGKTYFCAAVLAWMYQRVQYLRYWKERDFLSKIRASMEERGDYSQTIANYCSDHFIIFDDFGSTGINEWRKSVLLEFIDARYESGMPTVITSNLTPEDIQNECGQRIYSRLMASENLVINGHDWEDLRQHGK